MELKGLKLNPAVMEDSQKMLKDTITKGKEFCYISFMMKGKNKFLK